MISSIRVEMLGGLSVWADGACVLDSSGKINKPWQVFCYLVLNRQAPTPASKLIDALWADEDLTDPANVLKNTVYALRREFKAAKDTKQSPVLFENGGYVCNSAIVFDVDVEAFERQAKGVLDLVKNNANLRIQNLQVLNEVVDLYKGDLLPKLESEVWVMPRALYYKQLYQDCALQLCEGLYSLGKYNELLAVATQANRTDPLEESYYVYMFRALYALKMYRAIIPAYNKTARIFSEEMGATLGQEIRDIAAAASEQVDSIEQDIMIIKDDLREIAQDSGPISGPLYCTYDVFKYLYQMVARSSERAGGSVVIMLITLKQREEGVPPAKMLSAAMGQVKTLILGGLLRKSDVVARYSKSQYIVMLSIENTVNADMVAERIAKRCEPFLSPAGIDLVFAKTEMDPIG